MTDRAAIPDRVEVQRGADTLHLRWRWYRPAYHRTMLIVCVIFNVALLLFATLALFQGEQWKLSLPTVHVIAGAWITYAVVAGFKNRTTIRATSGQLTIEHGPLPWRGNRTFAREEVRQLYVEQVSANTPTAAPYNLCAMLATGRVLTVVKGIETVEQARYLENALEHHLAIDDCPNLTVSPERFEVTRGEQTLRVILPSSR